MRFGIFSQCPEEKAVGLKAQPFFPLSPKGDSPQKGFSVVKLHIQPPHTWPTGVTTPEKEALPSAAQWGQRGWTFHTRQAADALFVTLCQELASS
jgi:hypothetical protein